MPKTPTVAPLHYKIQETVGGVRIMQSGVKLKDAEMVTIVVKSP